ncbi:glycosyltransferase family 2 protein [Ornithinibacillus halophilus]|uniref:Glycosyl transferase family 2 n=1 Tax=Ornithinibacillus halophilus TaxID=930117 RepID=A0A1M5E9U0_9BACI|nr:glycosyltransferase family A protein [Ornithinibacillus halophilus]SHF75862.1 Glycosyl transferase family 2 [Ornithinibacillus halophilus]
MDERFEEQHKLDSDLRELEHRKNILEEKLIIEQEQSAHLNEELKKIEHHLHSVKNRYKREVNLRNKNKKELDKINKSRSWKLSLPVRKLGEMVKKNKSNDIETQVKHALNVGNESQKDNKYDARALDRKLWGGYSSYALKELLKLKTSQLAPMNERMRATRSISRWYYDNQEYQKAYEELEYINEVKPINNPNPDRIVTEIKVMKKLGATEAAKSKVWDAIEAKGLQSNLCLSMAHLAENEMDRLNWYNMIYGKYGYNQVRKLDEQKPLDLENIYTATTKVSKELEDYKVSVIIPAYNAADLIHIALDSLLKQTIQNIEIIVVDDCSPDNTADVVATYAEKDERIKLIKKEVNEGAYAARNTGLQYATGDYITVHDSDDWSHSQKIEIQLKALMKNPNAVGSISYLVRATKDTCPLNAGSLLSVKFLMMNSSSLLIRRDVITTLGGWDSVRVAGDTEFLWRIEKIYGKENVIRVEPSVPLSIALSNENSLTGTSTTHVKTIHFGLRRTYRESFQWWHEQADGAEDLYMDPSKINRHFPCPVPNKLKRPEVREYDVVVIADFSNNSNQELLDEMIKKYVNNNRKLGLFHWPDYHGDPTRTITDNIYYLSHKYDIDLLVPNEEITTEQLVILTPKILDYALDTAPVVTYQKAYVVDDEKFRDKKAIREKNVLKTLNVDDVEWFTVDQLKNM